MAEQPTEDPTRAEVKIGDFLASAELREDGVVFRITGAIISPKVFAHFIRKTHTMKFVRFEDRR